MGLKHLLLIVIAICSNQSYGSQWTKRTDFSSSGRHRASSVSVGNKGYMGLGHFNGTGVETYFNDWWEYDPATNAWSQKANYIGNNGNGELGARVIGIDTVCFVGLGELDHTSLYKYIPATNVWVQVASPPPSNQFRDTQDMVIGHKAYFTDLWGDELYEYDADLDVWTYKGLLPFSWYFVFSSFSHDGKAYIKAYDELWQYDPSVNSWTFINNFPGIARLASVCFMQYNKAYIICGYGATGSDVTSEVWQFDPVSQIWTQMEDFPGTSRRYSSGFSIGDKCYLGTGTNGTNLKDFWEFNAIAGMEEFDASSFNVYPNPAVNFVKFKSSKVNSFDIKVYDLNGKVMNEIHTENGEAVISREGVKSGTYLFNIEVDGRVVHSDQLLFI